MSTSTLARIETTETGQFIKVSVFYEKGGENWFSGSHNKRGYCLSAQLVKVEKNSYTNTKGERVEYQTEGFFLGTSGIKQYLAECKAFSAKKFSALRSEVLAGKHNDLLNKLVKHELSKTAGLRLTESGVEELGNTFGFSL